MLGRLLLGIFKGLILGGLIGFALAKVGMATPGTFFAYVAAAVTGVLIGLIAGKPIWAKDAKIEAGMKAFVGALLAAGLMYAARRWLTMSIPIELGALGGANESLGEAASNGTVGGLAITSLAAIAAALGGFYDADNNPAEASGAPAGKEKAQASKKRIAQGDAEEEDAELAEESEKKRSKN